MRQYLNWKTYLSIIALLIVSASIYFTNRLAGKLANEEKKKVEQVVAAIKASVSSTNGQEVNLATFIVSQNTTIPLIITDEQNNILDFNNVDTSKLNGPVKPYINKTLQHFKKMHPPIISDFGSGKSYIYYGESYLLIQLRYFPYVQLATIFLFLIVVLIALSAAHRSLQNQVWVGLSKETAHQLGTPLSSMEAWLEMLREQDSTNEAANELQKDLDRLKLVADRFSKVGSTPQLEHEDVLKRLQIMQEYMQKRAPSKVLIGLHCKEESIAAYISGSLFDWVIENLIRNALDAIDGKGKIDIYLSRQADLVFIDIADTGKGIPAHQINKIFNPGFTTKKRGWGLGLSLSKRIIEKYHHGTLLVKQSEPGKGTTFRIILKQ
jgi:two-component sensor histidine kinase